MKRAKKQATKRRRNGLVNKAESAAKRLYQKFHGKASRSSREVTTAVAHPRHLAELGKVIELHVDAPKGEFILQPKGVTLTSTPDGRQLYFTGGDQTPPLQQLGVDGSKVLVKLGRLTKIHYLTQKGFHDFEPIEYMHKMGEKGGTPPDLEFDTASKLLYVVGGTYLVKPEGIIH